VFRPRRRPAPTNIEPFHDAGPDRSPSAAAEIGGAPAGPDDAGSPPGLDVSSAAAVLRYTRGSGISTDTDHAATDGDRPGRHADFWRSGVSGDLDQFVEAPDATRSGTRRPRSLLTETGVKRERWLKRGVGNRLQRQGRGFWRGGSDRHDRKDASRHSVVRRHLLSLRDRENVCHLRGCGKSQSFRRRPHRALFVRRRVKNAVSSIAYGVSDYGVITVMMLTFQQ
jgi:hypothetical protein